jgi:hypothetical protein
MKTEIELAIPGMAQKAANPNTPTRTGPRFRVIFIVLIVFIMGSLGVFIGPVPIVSAGRILADQRRVPLVLDGSITKRPAFREHTIACTAKHGDRGGTEEFSRVIVL